jgi:adenylate kinase family enzyme
MLLAVSHHNAQFLRIAFNGLFLAVHGAEVEHSGPCSAICKGLRHPRQNLRGQHSSQGKSARVARRVGRPGPGPWGRSSPGRQESRQLAWRMPARPPGIRQDALVPEEGFTEFRSGNDISPGTSVGRRVVVTGMAGAGKSRFSRALSAKTGLPVIHLDIHFWKPGWVEPSEDEWRKNQRDLLTGDEWIVDGNYHATLDLRLERADTVVFLDTPWSIRAWRAFVRGVRRRPVGFQLPDGCDESALRRLREEWSLAWRIWRSHRAEREQELEAVVRHGNHTAAYVLRNKRAAHDFLGS